MLSTAFSGSCFAAGVGILDASKQTDITISCPVGVINCDAYTTRDAEASKFSATGTQTFLLKLLGGVLNFAALAAVVMLVIAGIRYATALGGDEALKTARNNVIWTIVGLLVIMIALLIVRNITETLYGVVGDKVTNTNNQATNSTTQATNSNSTTPVASDTPTPVAENNNPTGCNPPASIPASCYTGDINAVQTSISGCEVSREDLQPTCRMLGLAEDSDSSCNVSAVQQALISAGAYTGLPARCSGIDGRYGQCTVSAINAYCSRVNP